MFSRFSALISALIMIGPYDGALLVGGGFFHSVASDLQEWKAAMSGIPEATMA